jgi:hypothetical protein
MHSPLASFQCAHDVPASGPPPASRSLRRELEALPYDRLVLRTGPYTVVWAMAHEVPLTLAETAARRHHTARSRVFDQWYEHLFVLDGARIVAACRIGRLGCLLDEEGSEALSSSQHFDYDPRLFRHLAHGVELGLSFSETDPALEILWAGIRARLGRPPPSDRSRLQHLLVSVHLDDGSSLAVELSDLSRFVLPKTSDRTSSSRAPGAGSEGDRGSDPMFLQQCIELGGRVLGVHVHPDGGLEVLLLVELRE